jgi:hypothetical protein
MRWPTPNRPREIDGSKLVDRWEAASPEVSPIQSGLLNVDQGAFSDRDGLAPFDGIARGVHCTRHGLGRPSAGTPETADRARAVARSDCVNRALASDLYKAHSLQLTAGSRPPRPRTCRFRSPACPHALGSAFGHHPSD